VKSKPGVLGFLGDPFVLVTSTALNVIFLGLTFLTFLTFSVEGGWSSLSDLPTAICVIFICERRKKKSNGHFFFFFFFGALHLFTFPHFHTESVTPASRDCLGTSYRLAPMKKTLGFSGGFFFFFLLGFPSGFFLPKKLSQIAQNVSP